jgi:hypothetical protein
VGFEERFGGFGRGRVGGLMGRGWKQEPERGWKQEPERGKGQGERMGRGEGCFGLEVREGIWIRVLEGGVMSRGDVGVSA